MHDRAWAWTRKSPAPRETFERCIIAGISHGEPVRESAVFSKRRWLLVRRLVRWEEIIDRGGNANGLFVNGRMDSFARSFVHSFLLKGNWRFCFLYENGLISGVNGKVEEWYFFFFVNGRFNELLIDSFFIFFSYISLRVYDYCRITLFIYILSNIRK